jgi:hypothetical protein
MHSAALSTVVRALLNCHTQVSVAQRLKFRLQTALQIPVFAAIEELRGEPLGSGEEPIRQEPW